MDMPFGDVLSPVTSCDKLYDVCASVVINSLTNVYARTSLKSMWRCVVMVYRHRSTVSGGETGLGREIIAKLEAIE